MRKIEQDMIQAILGRHNFKRDNTEVERVDLDPSDPHLGYKMLVRLHGNLIAEYLPQLNSLMIRDGGWESNTTKSRLNVLLDVFAPTYGIVQRDWQWFIQSREDRSLEKWYGVRLFEKGQRLA